MPPYQSRHQPRKHTVVSGKIGNVECYDRFYDMAYEALRDGRFPHLTLPRGRMVVRSIEQPLGSGSMELNSYNPRQIPPGASQHWSVRFSGVRLDGRPGQGALYVGTIAGVLREFTHYSRPKPTPSTLWEPGSEDSTSKFMDSMNQGSPPPAPKKEGRVHKFYLFRVAHELKFADLRLTSLGPLFMAMRSGGGYQRYGVVDNAPADFLTAAASDALDYSASRGMSDAVFDLRRTTRDAGVCALSARADNDQGLVFVTRSDPTGGLVFAIFGADSSIVAALEPVPNPKKIAGAPAFDPVPTTSNPAVFGFDRWQDLSAALA
jgi:hypothetical protein